MHELLADKNKINSWLNDMNVKDYNLMPNKEYGWVVNCARVNIRNSGIREIKVKFNRVLFDFVCSDCELTSLHGSPSYVGNTFDCSRNFHLASLVGAPTFVGENFLAGYCHIISANGLPSFIGKNIELLHNDLTSLEGCPDTVRGNFDASYNSLSTIKGSPKKIEGDYFINNNSLETLEYCPSTIGGSLDITNCNLKTLLFCPNLVKGSVSSGRNRNLIRDNITNFKELKSAQIEYEILKSKNDLVPQLVNTPPKNKNIKNTNIKNTNINADIKIDIKSSTNNEVPSLHTSSPATKEVHKI